MGGKTKQRTKNNVRPSSSGRSAELLSSTSLDGSVVNIAGTQVPALFPSLVTPFVDSLLTPELQLAFKKLHKKDPVTKAKALQELSELVPQSKVEDVVAALPSWAHFYRVLTADPDRKVRELTQSCHGTIVSACGRRVAPHLKHLMPAWLQAQYDDHGPATTNAAASLHNTFPDNKLPEVLAFCKDEIITHFLDNLIRNGDNAFIRKTDSPEEAGIQRNRVLCSSLGGLQYCVSRMPRSLDAWLEGELRVLIDTTAFWKYATNANTDIRAAWYACMASIIQRYPGMFASQHGGRLLKLSLGNRETDSKVAAALWECLLAFMHHVQDWHKYLDKKELFCKRVLEVLESGGWGDARRLSSVLLPLLAHLPQDLLTDDFYTSFFDALLSGLDKKTILSSKSERQSWITTLEECLRYVSLQPAPNTLALVTGVHRRWLGQALAAGRDVIACSAVAIASLARYWLKKAETDHEKYDRLVRNHWQNITSTITSQASSLVERDDVTRTLTDHVILLRTLRKPTQRERKSVRFYDSRIESDPSTPEVAPNSPEVALNSPEVAPNSSEVASESAEVLPKSPNALSKSSEPIKDEFTRQLSEVVQIICARYLETARDKWLSEPILTQLLPLIEEFDSPQLFAGVARQLGCDTPQQLYSETWRWWVASDTMRCRALVELVFMMIKHFDVNEQTQVLHTFDSMPPVVIEWCILVSLSPPYRSSPSVCEWLQGGGVADAIRGITLRAVRGDKLATDLLLRCLQEDVISGSSVSEVLRIVTGALREVGEVGEVSEVSEAAPLEARAALAASLALHLASHSPLAPLAPSDDLILALVLLSIENTCDLDLGRGRGRGRGRLSSEVSEAVRDAWSAALASLEFDRRCDICKQAASLLHHKLNFTNQNESINISIEEIENIVSLCPYFLNKHQLDINELLQFTKTIFDFVPTEPVLVEPYALRHDIVQGRLNCPYDDNEITKAVITDQIDELTKTDLILYKNKVLFKTLYLQEMLLSDEENYCDDVFKMVYFKMEFCKILYEYMVICTLHNGYAFWSDYEIIEETKLKLDSVLNNVISSISPSIQTQILETLTEQASAKGYYYSYARKYFEDKVKSNINTNNEEKSEVVSEENDSKASEVSEATASGSEDKGLGSSAIGLEVLTDSVTGSGFFHSLQADGAPGAWGLVSARSVLCAHAQLEAVQRAVGAGGVGEGGELLLDLMYAAPDIMLYDKDLHTCPWSQVICTSSIVEYLRDNVSTNGYAMSAHAWDATTIAACSLLQAVSKGVAYWGDTKMATVTVSTLRLVSAVQQFVASVASGRGPSTGCAPHVALLPAEWTDVFAPDLTTAFYNIVLHVLESSSTTTIQSPHIAVISSLMSTLPILRYEWLPGAARATLSLKRIVSEASRVMSEATPPPYKYLAYSVLSDLLEPCVLADASSLASWSETTAEEEESNTRPELTLQYHHTAFTAMLDILDAALTHLKAGEETCSLEAGSDVHSVAVGLLLLTDLLYRQCRLARADLPHHYIQIYREGEYAERLLLIALRLLPTAVMAAAHAHPAPNTAAPSAADTDMFTTLPKLDVYERADAALVSRLACRALYACVAGAGCAAARAYRAGAAPKHAALLDHLAQRYITPHVVKEEFTLLQKKAADIEDTEIRVNLSTYEAWCRLEVEERSLELWVRLSRSHPLQAPAVVAPRAVAASAAHHTHWLVLYLAYQNGTVLNAMKMWAESVVSKVERSAQCYICYCRLHPTGGKLPNVTCYTCRNKFHNLCLRKWFSTSGKSNCPLCRTKF